MRVPADALWIRVVRSPHARAPLHARRPRRRCARVRPGRGADRGRRAGATASASIPTSRTSRCWPTARCAIAARRSSRWSASATASLAIRDDDVPIPWDAAAAGRRHRRRAGAPARRCVQADKPGNVLLDGGVSARRCRRRRSPPAPRWPRARSRPPSSSTPISSPRPAGPQRVGDRIEIHVSHPDALHGPRRDRDRAAASRPSTVRIVPTACGGGFGGKLDLSVQPLLAVAAWKLGRPVRWSTRGRRAWRPRPSAIPARIARAASAATPRAGSLACEFDGDFDTGAYASWGPTVANRVPVHATGPYRVPNVRTLRRARSTPTHRRPAPSAASACRRRRSRTRR